MKTKSLLLALPIVVLGFTATSCSKDNSSKQQLTETKEVYINATTKATWHYFSLSENKIIGTGAENVTDNAAWAARTDWDMALNRYTIRTNSGAATSVAAQGGVYTFSAATSFNSVVEVPLDTVYAIDKVVASESMGGVTTTVQSNVTVILFKKNEDGSTVMPPVYLQAPVYVFRTADGKSYYKVQFTQYQDENKVTGHVKFYSAQIK